MRISEDEIGMLFESRARVMGARVKTGVASKVERPPSVSQLLERI
jgi:hypothetical protein